MCKLSYEKCVCFVLLVIVAFLSCSGFRIDRLAMTDISKRNSHTSSSLASRSNNLFLDRLVAISTDDDVAANVRHQQRYRRSVESKQKNRTNLDDKHRRSRHKIRHARKLRRLDQAALIESDRNVPKAWIDVRIIDAKNESETNRNLEPPPNLPQAITTSLSATRADLPSQILPSDVILPRPTHAIVNRLQRSARRKHRQKRRKRKPNNHCQKQDLARNAYIADTVMLARAESMSLNRTVNANYSVTFKIIEVFKSKEPGNSETIRLTFIYSRRSQNCEPRHESRLVKANIRKMKEYFLFLKSDGSYSYTVYRTPMLRKKEPRKKGGKRDGDRRRNGNSPSDGQIAIVRKVCNATFEPILQVPQIVQVQDERTISITCTAKGFPIPIITWFRNNVTKIPPDLDRRQVVYNRRNSTLTIDKTEYEVYKCVASIGDKWIASKETLDKNSDIEPCKPGEPYCTNGGQCFMLQKFQERFCSCLDGFEGLRCEQKSSTYQQNITSCNLPHYKDEHFCKE